MKDARGHGSNARGGGGVNRYGQTLMPSVSQVPLGSNPGERGIQAQMGRIGQDQAAAAHLAAGVPASKSGPAPAHSAMSRFARGVRQAFRNSDG